MNTTLKYCRIVSFCFVIQLLLNPGCNKSSTTPCYNGSAYSFRMNTQLLNEKEVITSMTLLH